MPAQLERPHLSTDTAARWKRAWPPRQRQRQRPRKRLAFEGFAMLASTALVALVPASVQSSGQWSQPSLLDRCSAAGGPTVVFPSNQPNHATGAGAIAWAASPLCRGAAVAQVAALGAGSDLPGSGSAPITGSGESLGLGAPLSAAPAPAGRMLLAAPLAARPGGELALSEGPASGPFAAPASTGGAARPLALSTAYLGDVALVSPASTGAHRDSSLALRVHRFYQGSFRAPARVVGPAAGRIEGLAVAMDYRSDAFALWERSGALYGRDMPASGRSSRPVQTLAQLAPHAEIAALLSDDNRAIIAWTETRGGRTSVYAELSAVGVRFTAPRLLEQFVDPRGEAPSTPPRLVRLSSESVMLAWSGASGGHWVVHTAAVDLNGVHTVNTISAAGREAVLADLAPGPDGEAFALWSEPQPGAGGRRLGAGALQSARGIDAYPGLTEFSAPETIAPAGTAGTSGEASLAVDPNSDRAVAAWRTPAGAVEYSLRSLGRG